MIIDPSSPLRDETTKVPSRNQMFPDIVVERSREGGAPVSSFKVACGAPPYLKYINNHHRPAVMTLPNLIRIIEQLSSNVSKNYNAPGHLLLTITHPQDFGFPGAPQLFHNLYYTAPDSCLYPTARGIKIRQTRSLDSYPRATSNYSFSHRIQSQCLS